MPALRLTNVAEFLRASHISRWGIVQLAVRQNIAEHMYRVWTLVRFWGKIVELTPDEQATCEQLALTHDLPEIRTGDAPTPHKTPEMKQYLAQVEQEIYPELHELGQRASAKVVALFKFCDTAEAVLFLHVNGLGAHTLSVEHLLEKQMLDRLEKSPFSEQQRVHLSAAFDMAKSDT